MGRVLNRDVGGRGRPSWWPSRDILAFQEALEAHFLAQADVEGLARVCGVTVTRLQRRVKDELGMTVNQAVGERLPIEARYRLRTGETAVKEIAHDLG